MGFVEIKLKRKRNSEHSKTNKIYLHKSSKLIEFIVPLNKLHITWASEIRENNMKRHSNKHKNQVENYNKYNIH